jgi:pilus assembly protein FimV
VPSFDFDLGADSPAPAPSAAPAAVPDFNFDLNTEGPTRRVEPVPVPPAPAPAPSSDFSFDFDSLLSPAPAAPAPAAPAPDEQRTDTMALPDLDSLMNSLAPSPAPAPAPAAKEPSLDLGDLDLNFDDLKSPVGDFKPIELETRMPPQSASALEQPEVIPLDTEFNLDDPSFLGGNDAIATKLDLARAYIDMSDPDGARAMLEEVLIEGTDAQKQEARDILARIG